MSIKYVLLPIISSLIVTFKSCSWNETDIAELQSNLTTAIDSVRLNPVDYYGYIFNITYPDYLYIKKRLYMLRYYDKDSTKRFYTGYGINERTMQIISGPEYSDMDSEKKKESILDKDEHMQTLLLQLLQFRRIANIGTITYLQGWYEPLQDIKKGDMWFVFWYKRNCYKLTHYTDHEFLPTDTIVHGDWLLQQVEPLPW